MATYLESSLSWLNLLTSTPKLGMSSTQNTIQNTPALGSHGTSHGTQHYRHEMAMLQNEVQLLRQENATLASQAKIYE
jgi:hypothetical protein